MNSLSLVVCFVILVLSSAVQAANTSDSTRSYQMDDYECNQDGYLEYLSRWSVIEKSTSRNPLSTEFSQRLQYFIDSCNKIHKWNTRHKYEMEFTYYADWHPEEFEEITATIQRYSGANTPFVDDVEVYNNSNLRYLLPSIDPCNDEIEGRNILREYISKPQNCTVSWAFAVTNSIEYAIKKLYLEEYDQTVSVALSAQELIDCVGKDQYVDDVCNGLPIAWGFDYAVENGIAYRQYYHHTNKPGDCIEIDPSQKYYIEGFEKPLLYNKHGLFDLVKKGPVAVTLGLDPNHFQYYRNDRDEGPYFDTAFWRPSVFGVVVEYYQYHEDSDELAKWPYFAIETRLRACDSMIFRIPIRDSSADANIAGIAGFAIRPIVAEKIESEQPTNPELPTSEQPNTDIPTTFPTTTLLPTEQPTSEPSDDPTSELPTTEPPTILPTDVPTEFVTITPTPPTISFICNETIYPTINPIPSNVTD